MELLDRYLNAVAWWLPSGQKRDLVAELGDDLRSQMEERQRSLGRPLDEAEIAAILKRCGHPLTVAGRYMPDRVLMDPGMSVLYVFVIKVVLLWILLPALAIVFLPAVLTAEQPAVMALHAWAQGWQSAIFTFGTITALFAIAQRIQVRSRWRDTWDPRRLPRVRDARLIPRGSSVVEIVFTFVFAGFWIAAKLDSLTLARVGVPWTAGPVWQHFQERFFLSVLLLTLATLAMSAVNVARPYWTRLRLGLRSAVNVVSACILLVVLLSERGEFLSQCRSLRAHVMPQSTPEAGAVIMNVSVYGSLLIATLVVAIVILVDVFRIFTWKSGTAPTGSSV